MAASPHRGQASGRALGRSRHSLRVDLLIPVARLASDSEIDDARASKARLRVASEYTATNIPSSADTDRLGCPGWDSNPH
jgi:hypothetical protein